MTQNILFGSVYEKERYEATIEACALKPDLDMFDARDETGELSFVISSSLLRLELTVYLCITEIGERGISYVQFPLRTSYTRDC